MRRVRPGNELLVLLLALGVGLAACGDGERTLDDPAGEDPQGEDPRGEDPRGEDPRGEDPGPRLPTRLPPATGSSPGLDPEIFPSTGSKDFISANESELLSAGTSSGQRAGYGQNARGAMDMDDADGMSAGAGAWEGEAPPASPAVAPEPEADPDVSREIVEADIFKHEGDYLYVLNRNRGLAIIDVSDPDAMRVAGRFPFQAVPVEMYLRDGRAYIVMSDYFVYWQYDPDADPLGFHGSQILIVDVADPDNPQELGRQLVEGEITDTRMVGDVLYTVSKRRPDFWRYNTADWQDQTWVVSLNLTDPEDIREIDRITFSGTSTLIHVAHHAIFVSAWDPNYYLTDPDHEQETLLTYVDISDPAGDLRQRGTIYVPGTIQDKFKINWHDHTLRVISSQYAYCSRYYYGYGMSGYGFNCRYGGNGMLHTIDTSFPDELEHLASIKVYEEDNANGRNSALYASRYAGERAYTMTTHWERYHDNRGRQRYRGINLLHAFDLSVPDDPYESDSLVIDQRVTHFQVAGDRLLALGSQEEWYLDRSDGIWRTHAGKVQLSLYDGEEPDRLDHLSTELLGLGYSYSVANNDYKALRVVPELELILVPLQYSYRAANHRYERFNGVQLVDWVGDDLEERGRVETHGRVQRAFPVGDRIVAVSNEHVEAIDPTDRDEPVATSAVHLQRTIYEVFDVDGLAVQLVGPDFTGGLRFEVLEFSKDDDTPALATLDLPFSGTPICYRDGDVIHMIGYERDHGQTVRNADFTQVEEPRLVGFLKLVDALTRIYSEGNYQFDALHNGGVSWYWRYWNPFAGLPLRNQLLPFTVRRIQEDASGRRGWESELRLVDLRDVENPRIADGTVPMNDFPFINKVTHGEILYSGHVEQAVTGDNQSLLYHVRAFVDRVDVSDPDHPVLLPSLNVPGWLIDASDDGTILFTIDYQWDDFGRRRNSLNVLRVEGDEAVLVDVMPVGDQVNRGVFRDRTIWLTTHKYPWWGVRGETVESRQPYTILHKVTVDELGNIVGDTEPSLKGYHFDLLDVEGTSAYLASTGPYGVLVLDVEDAEAPVIVNAARTVGYVSKLVPHGEHLYMPLGAYGVHRVSRSLVF